MSTFIIFLIVISALVVVHEAGHFWAARRAGMKVLEFGFGFPPRLFGRKRGETVYSINAIPFGGFVRIFGEDGEHRRTPGSFGHGTFWQKVLVITAGVLMNFLFAVVLLFFSNMLGLRVGVFDEATRARATDLRVQILQVAPDSPAEAGGLRALDEIAGFRENGALVAADGPEAVQAFAFSHAGKPVVMVVRRGDALTDIPLTLRQPSGPEEGPIGISLALTGELRYPWYEALWRAGYSGALIFWGTLQGYGHIISSLVTSGSAGGDISGPVGIATLTGQAARIGFNYLLQFVALISINLAVLNILPFPALDGGRLVLVIAERLRGKSLSDPMEQGINAIGFAILVILMVLVTIRDIVKFF